jgi:hypothetical protein
VTKLTSPVLVLAALAAVLVGCGDGSSSASAPTGGAGVNGISVGNCLNDEENFLVQPSQAVLDGQSPAGVTFTLTLYKSNAAAAAAFAKKSPQTTALVENGVIDFKGNPPVSAGAPAATISQADLSAIKRCIDSAKASG